jgi:deazaflavin-dependent oxidoreductase (nitroreductase family)
MSKSSSKPGFHWRFMRSMNKWMVRNYQRGFGPTKVVLLLTTTGRKSGLRRVTPLQYEEIDGAYYLGSARGANADWFCNLLVDPMVEVQIKRKRFKGVAEAITDPVRIADFFQVRLKRHPIMIGLLMRLEGLPLAYKREDLEKIAANKTLALIRPLE